MQFSSLINKSFAFFSILFQLNLTLEKIEGEMSNYQQNGEFHLEGYTPQRNVKNYSCCPEPYPDITYALVMRRRPMFYVFNLILPCILINLIGKLKMTIGWSICPDSWDKLVCSTFLLGAEASDNNGPTSLGKLQINPSQPYLNLLSDQMDHPVQYVNGLQSRNQKHLGAVTLPRPPTPQPSTRTWL